MTTIETSCHPKTGKFHCGSCGWSGPDLRRSGCVTYGDTYSLCPECGTDTANIEWVDDDREPLIAICGHSQQGGSLATMLLRVCEKLSSEDHRFGLVCEPSLQEELSMIDTGKSLSNLVIEIRPSGTQDPWLFKNLRGKSRWKGKRRRDFPWAK